MARRKKAIEHPNHTETLPRLKRAQGQVDAVGRMIEEKKYCPDILQQLRAAISALKALEAVILQNHLEHCVQDAMLSRDKNIIEGKISELIRLIRSR